MIPGMKQAQRAWDAQMPPDDGACEETVDCPECEGGGCGECNGTGEVTIETHAFRRIPGTASDDAKFMRCKRCGKVEEC